jgi:hypothetical protein
MEEMSPIANQSETYVIPEFTISKEFHKVIIVKFIFLIFIKVN